MTDPERRPLGRARAAFIVIIVFVMAQVAWWLLFQERYIADVVARTAAAWQREALIATVAAQADPASAPELAASLPHLRRLPAGGFEVDAAQLRAFERRQVRYVRMFWFEAPFFVLVVLSGLHVIARSLAAARELKRRQQNFLAAVTHEFRTPISTLRLLIETARYRDLAPERLQDYLQRMEAELSRLERTGDRVLASARLEHGEPYTLAPHDLNEVVRGFLAKSRAGFETRGAELHVEYASAPLPALLAEEAVELVLDNLLDNAIKYTPGEPKPVRLTLERLPGRARLHVVDEGVGVPPGLDEAIFAPFYRTGNELTRASTGVGLGLHLVRSSLSAMNAKVWCSAHGAALPGTRFTLEFPLVEA